MIAGLLDDVLRMGRGAVIVVEPHVLARLDLGRLDLAHLVLQKRKPLLPFRLAHFQCRLFLLDAAQFTIGRGTSRAERTELAKGIEQFRLLVVRQQRLVIVRTVHIDEPVAERLQYLQRHGAAIDELPVRTRGGHGALKQKSAAVARLRARFAPAAR